MKAIGIVGSPRKNGNTEILTRHTLKAIEEEGLDTELVRLAGYISLRKRAFAGKVGGPLVVARRAGQNFTFAQLMYWFHILGFFMPSSTYWNIAFGHEKGQVSEDEEGLRTAWNFGKNIALLVKKLKT